MAMGPKHATARATAPDLQEETSLMMSGNDDPNMEGKFRASRKISYNHKEGKCAVIAWHTIETCWQLYVLFLAASAIVEVSYANETWLSKQTWLIFLAAATTVSFAWLTLASICAIRNANAVRHGAAELPCPELRTTVIWSTVLLGTWATALGFEAIVFINNTTANPEPQIRSWEVKMWIVIIVCLVNTLDWLRYVCRWMVDYMLICCKSPCYDL